MISRAVFGAVAALCAAAPAASQAPPPADYWVYVANESSDIVSRVRFGPDGIAEEKKIRVGVMPADLDGAHGLSVSRDGRHWYLSLAHGNPYGQVWKFATGSDRIVDSATAGLFPATMGITPDGGMLFASNFNLHGNHVPSSVSVFFTPQMQEMTKITTCIMPHGGRVNRAGTSHYSACMMSDQLVEISTQRLTVTRRLSLTQGEEQLLPSEAADVRAMGAGVCKPTWVTVAADDSRLYVPCNGRGEVLEINAETFEIERRFSTGTAPYNADASPDGRYLVVSLKGAQAVAIFDLATGRESRVSTSQPVTHGVAVTPDSRYAFISNEAVGRTRGTVDVIDLEAKTRVASVAVQHQPGGIGFWKMEPRGETAARR
ncbi:MAG: YncE family protein [Gemmatimonadales bacterium]|nr:YncE family protein [Gemmatimonadales bacterium]